jgi:hypothetical protein
MLTVCDGGIHRAGQDLSQRVTALEAQLEVSEQQNEERKQAQEILNEELLEQRRRYDEEKRKWAAQIDQLKEKYIIPASYFSSLVR